MSIQQMLFSTGIQAYRYWRWEITAVRSSGNYVQVSEFNLLNNGTVIDMPTPTNPGGSNPAAEGPEKIADGTTSTKWLDFNSFASGQDNSSVLIFDMGTPIFATDYRWYTANDASNRDPISWNISASNDGSNYTTLATVSNATITTSRFALAGTFSL